MLLRQTAKGRKMTDYLKIPIVPCSSCSSLQRCSSCTKPKFIFDSNPAAHPNAIPFDMFQGAGFGHEGDHGTFETLCLAFDISDKRVLVLAQAIHDADIEDGKFGRHEGHAMNQILRGWAAQNVPDDQLLRRGMDLIEGFYNSIPQSEETLP